MRLYYFIFLSLFFVDKLTLCELKLSSLKDALVYKGEKLVYISIGSYSKTDLSQALPNFAATFLKQFPHISRCIEIDPDWKDKGIKQSALYKNVKDTTEYHNLFTLVGEKLEDKHEDNLIAYMMDVLKTGGIVVIGVFTGPNIAPHSMNAYNTVKKLFKDSVQLFTAPPDAWWNGNEYSYYDELLLLSRIRAYKALIPSLKELISEPTFSKDPRATITEWYIKFFKDEVKRSIRPAFDLFKSYNKPQYFNIFLKVYYDLPDDKIINDLLYKNLSCTYVPKITQQLSLNIALDKGKYSIQQPVIVPFDIFDFSAYNLLLSPEIVAKIKNKNLL